MPSPLIDDREAQIVYRAPNFEEALKPGKKGTFIQGPPSEVRCVVLWDGTFKPYQKNQVSIPRLFEINVAMGMPGVKKDPRREAEGGILINKYLEIRQSGRMGKAMFRVDGFVKDVFDDGFGGANGLIGKPGRRRLSLFQARCNRMMDPRAVAKMAAAGVVFIEGEATFPSRYEPVVDKLIRSSHHKRAQEFEDAVMNGLKEHWDAINKIATKQQAGIEAEAAEAAKEVEELVSVSRAGLTGLVDELVAEKMNKLVEETTIQIAKANEEAAKAKAEVKAAKAAATRAKTKADKAEAARAKAEASNTTPEAGAPKEDPSKEGDK